MMKDVLSVKQFTDKELLEKLFEEAAKMQVLPPAQYPNPLDHLTLATIFYEPSTRTRLSFETAIQNLGGKIITTENAAQFSSAMKGESLEDTVKVINMYADGIILRHPEVGSAEKAASVSDVPLINAGDGAGEHPTQALLDTYSMHRSRGSIDGLKIALVGDLLYGRAVHSLLPLLAVYDVELYLLSPKSLELPKEYLEELDRNGVKYTVLNSWGEALPEIDVLYMTRVQKERFKLIEDYQAVKDDFILTTELAGQMKEDAIILHPLPRVNEIDPAIDSDPRAQYFQQVKNGLFLRMALLAHIYNS
ncbi:MAG TPA: aspartate carbamoyltransferase [Candidatus Saccharimonadales bacterium]|nr:aspartate carbamoyltransferase [Candidatus Saccharimonadales bacterium]